MKTASHQSLRLSPSALLVLLIGIAAGMGWFLANRPSSSDARAVQQPPVDSSETAPRSKQVKFTGLKLKVPDLDVREVKSLPPLDLQRAAALAALSQEVPGVHVEFDRLSTAPSYVQAVGRFLTLPAEGKAARKVVEDFIEQRRDLFGHGGSALTAAHLTREDKAAHNGLTTLVWNQQLDGIPLFKTILKASVTKRGELVNISDHFLHNPALASGKTADQRTELVQQPPVTAANAVALAVGSWDETIDTVAAAGPPDGATRKQSFTASGLSDTTAQLTWIPTSGERVELAWDVITFSAAKKGMYRVIVDAISGKVLYRTSLTNDISNATYQVFAKSANLQPFDSPTPMAPGLATPTGTQPAAVSREAITTQALNTTASPNGWINDGGQETLGNNVDAHTDLNSDNVADTPRPNGGVARNFSFPLDLAQAPSTYRDAAVTHLFYLNNYIHDRFYELGFTEAAGNFQTSNFGRGGLGNDAVQADAQDGSGTNNANFSTPPDGTAGRMQMYVFTGPTPDIDGDFDGEIVIHEYTHGLSNRLVGGGSGISELQPAGMGEGWSDFYGLCLLSEPGDDPNGNYAAGAYATHQFYGEVANYYFGIRRYPYSTDMTKNPLTLKDIDPTQASAHAGIPYNTIFGTPNGNPGEVHNQGEVWCMALWEARANLIAAHGHATGNQLILQLVTDGMKLAPVNPTFLEARDAIIQADLVNNAGTNRIALWSGFAKRGMGVSASVPANFTTTGVVESYDLPDDLSVTPSTLFTATGDVGGPFSPASRSFTLTNTGSASLNWTAGTTLSWLTLSSSGGTLTAGASTTVTATINASAAALPQGVVTGNVVFTNTTSTATLLRQMKLIVGEQDYFTEVFDTSPHDIDNQSFLFTPNGSSQFYRVQRTNVTSYPTDPTGGTSISLGDDTFNSITLTGGAHVSLYGVDYTTIYVGSNGYLTFGNGDSSLSASLSSHFALPRIAALMTDLYPTSSNVTWRQLADRVAITFNGVSEYGTANSNNFQFELFFDGRIRITNLGIDVIGGLIGLSGGLGIPADFIESDFSSYADRSLTLNFPVSVSEGAGVLTGQGSVTLTQAAATDVMVTLTSTSTEEATVPASVTVLAGNTSATFDITLIDDALLDGTQSTNITAAAASYPTATRAFQVTDNETAILSLVMSSSFTEGAADITGTLTVSAPVGRSVSVPLISTVVGLDLPTTVIIPSGATSATFIISTADNEFTNGTRTGTASTNVAGWTNANKALTLLDDESNAIHVTVEPASVLESINSTPCLVGFLNPVAADTEITLASSSSADATVPASVIIPAGEMSVSFDITVINDTVSEPDEVLTLSGSAVGFTTGSAPFTIVDDDVHHFAFSSILSPQAVTGPFAVTLSARNASNGIVTGYTGTATVAANTSGTPLAISVNPASLVFVEGECSLTITINTLATGARLTAQSASGVGVSNFFDIATVGVPTSFEFSTISSPKTKDVPFPVTITAKDSAANTVTNYNGSAQLALKAPSYANIETGAGTADLLIPFESSSEQSRTQLIYLPSEVGPARSISWLEMDVRGLPTPALNHFTVRMKHTLKPNYNTAPVWESTGWTTVYSATLSVTQTGWLRLNFTTPFVYNGTSSLMVDMVNTCTNPVAFGLVGGDDVSGVNGDLRDLFYSTSGAADPLTWSGAGPGANADPYVLNLRLSGVPVGLSGGTAPSLTGSFTNGVWTGSIAAERSGVALQLVASDAAYGVSSSSNAFDVQSVGVLALSVTGTLVEGGVAATGTVTLPAATVADTIVTLLSGDTTEAIVPANVTVLSGQTSATFAITPVEDALLDGTQPVTITAHLATYDDASAALSVDDNETAILSVSLPSTALESAGVLIGAGTVTVSAAPAAPITVTLVSSNPSRLIVPLSVTIPTGSTSVTFDLEVTDDLLINAALSATVTASVPGWTAGSGLISLPDDESRDVVLDLFVASVGEAEGTVASAGQVVLAAEVEADTTFTLASSSNADATVPLTVTIPAGFGAVAFDLTIMNDTIPEHDEVITVSASAPTFTAANKNFTLIDDELDHLQFASIGASQIANKPFAVSVSAVNLDGSLIATFAGPAALTANAGGSPVPISPTLTGAFVNGSWSGNAAITTGATGVTITATAGAVSGTSNAFDVGAFGSLHHFEWAAITSPQTVGASFPVTVTAKDLSNNTVSSFNDVTSLTGFTGTGAGSSVLISEINPNSPDEIEFTNVSSSAINLSGWQIYVYDDVSWPAPLSVFTIPAGSTCAAGQLFRLQENGTTPGTFPQFYFGSNISWNPLSTSHVAVMLRNSSGTMVDFACVGSAAPASITSPSTIPSTQWSGATVNATTSSTSGYSRIGNADSNALADWSIANLGLGTLNPGLSLPFPGAELPVLVSPTVSGTFTSGVWTGNLTVSQTASQMKARASDGAGHAGESTAFDVISLGSLTITAPASATEGAGPLSGAITLPAAAAADVTVTLTSSDPTAATVPTSVTIVTGNTSASFSITPVDDALLDGSQITTIGASSPGYVPGSAGLTVNDNEVAVLGVTLPASAAEGAGVLTNQGTVTVSLAPTQAVTVTLTSSDTTELTVPASVVIPAGATSVTFTPTVVNDTVIDGAKNVTVTAQVPGWTDGSGSINITDNESTAISVSLSQSTVSEIIGNLSGTITLPAPVESATVISLSNSSPSDATVPASVTIPANGTSVNFTLSVINDTVYEEDKTLVITASNAGLTTGTTNLLLLDNDPHHFAFSAIGVSQSVSAPFSVTITAQKVDNSTMTMFVGTADLSAAVGVTSVSMTPAVTGSFNLGVWTGNLAVTQPATGVAVTASRNGATGTSNTFNVTSSAPDHFAISTISSLQAAGTPFSVTITAQTAGNATVTSFTGTVNLSALTVNGTPIILSPTVSGNFVAGVWTGSLTVGQAGQGITLTANDGSGHIGTSNSFNVGSTAAWFDVSSISANVTSGTARSVTLTARDSAGNVDSTFTGTANLISRAPGLGQLLLGKGSGTSGTMLNASFHDCRTQTLYTAAQMGGRAMRLNGIALNVVNSNATVFNSFIIRLRHSTKTTYSGAAFTWESTNWTTAYTANQTFSATGWQNFTFSTPFDYNGADSLMLDISFDNAATGSTIALRTDAAESAVMLSATSNSLAGAPTTWAGTTPAAGGLATTPQVKFFLPGDITVSPQLTTSFVSGVWTGNLTFTGAANDLSLQVIDGFGRTGNSNTFTLSPAPVTMTAEPAYTGGTSNPISWSTSANATSYEAQAAASTTFTTPVWTATPATNSATATGLNHATAYHYRARARSQATQGDDAWTQTDWGDFAADTHSGTNSDILTGSITLAGGSAPSTTTTENFNALTGGAWTSLLPVTGGNVGFTLVSSALTAGPNTTPELPINQGTDLEGRLSGSFVWALGPNNASGIFSDGYVEAYVCAETPAANIQGGLLIRAGTGPTGSLFGYHANLIYSSATTAIINLGYHQSGGFATSSSIAVSTADIIRLRLSAKGSRLTVNAWKVAIVGGVVTETAINLVGANPNLTAYDTRYGSGRAGIKSTPGSGAFLVEDLTVSMERPVYSSSGTVTSPAISPSVRSQWGTLTYTSDTTASGTSLSVDVLNGSTNAVLASAVASGTNLNTLPAVASVPSLKLRANLATTNTANTPALHQWSLAYTATAAQTPASAWSTHVSSTQDSSAPVLTASPLHTSSSSAAFSGTATDSVSGVASVTVNSLSASTTNGYANWTRSLTGLSDGTNTLTISASDSAVPPNTSTLTTAIYRISTPAADNDTNGIPNLLEHAFNITANPPHSQLPVTGSVIDGGSGAHHLTLQYRRRIQRQGLQYFVDTSTDLITWDQTGADVSEISATPTGDGVTETVTVRISPAMGAGNPAKFVRVRAAVQP